MKVLLLPDYFQPEVVSSTLLHDQRYRALSESGIDMICYTPFPCRGIDSSLRKHYKKIRTETLYDGRMKVYRFHLFKEGTAPALRALRYFIQCVKQFNRGVFTKEHYDVISVGSTPPIQGMMADLVKIFRKKPVVYYLQDIFPDSLVGTGLAKKNGILWKIGRVIENFTYKHADKIIVISEDFKKNIMAKGVPEEKIEVIYNWVDENAVVPIAKEDNPLYKEFDINPDKFNVVYAGNLGAAQNIDIILDAAERTLDDENINYIIFGSEAQSAPYINKVRDRKLTNVKILPIQPFNRVSYVYSLGDVAIVPCKKGFGSIGMPSKTWSIMSSETAVLASFDGGTDMQRIIEGNKVGVFTEAEDIDAFTNAIISLSKNRNETVAMGKRGREFILKNLTREIGTSKYVKVLRDVVNASAVK